jgi:hypothetical protein
MLTHFNFTTARHHFFVFVFGSLQVMKHYNKRTRIRYMRITTTLHIQTGKIEPCYHAIRSGFDRAALPSGESSIEALQRGTGQDPTVSPKTILTELRTIAKRGAKTHPVPSGDPVIRAVIQGSKSSPTCQLWNALPARVTVSVTLCPSTIRVW